MSAILGSPPGLLAVAVPQPGHASPGQPGRPDAADAPEAPGPARAGLQCLRWAITDVRVLTWRTLARIATTPEQLLNVTVQPLICVLLFSYVFNGAIILPGHGNYREYLITSTQHRGNSSAQYGGTAVPGTGETAVPLLFLIGDTGGGHRSAAQAVVQALGAAYPGRFGPVIYHALRGRALPCGCAGRPAFTAPASG